MHRPSTRPYAVLRLMQSFSTLFALVPYSAFSMAFVAAGFCPTGSGHCGSNNFPFLINVSTSPQLSSFVLRYAVVSCRHSDNCPPLVPVTAVKIDLQRVQRLAFPSKSFPLNGVLAAESVSYLVCVRRRLLLVLCIKPPHSTGCSTRSMGNYLIYVETNGFHRDGHAVETMDAKSQAPSLPVKIYLDEIDKLGNYESILP